MARIKEQEIDKRLEANRKLVQKTSERNAAIRDRTEKVLAWSIDQEPLRSLDFNEDTTFEEARGNQKVFEDNVAVLIHGLDQATSSFGDDFKSMSQSTTGEKLMGFFSKRKADAMRTDRVRNTDLTENLRQLIDKSNALSTLLREGREQTQEVRDVLFDDFPKVREQLSATTKERLEVEASIKRIEKDQQDIAVQAKDVTDPSRRRDLDTAYANLATDLNKANGRLQSLMATEQSLEKYSNQYQNYMSGLDTQLAGQETLIAKLELDSEKRSLLYSALEQSIKLNAQQDVAHKVNVIGSATDAFAESLIANNKMASSNKMIEMYESHDDLMKKTEEITRIHAASDRAFKERFSTVIEKTNDRTQFVERT